MKSDNNPAVLSELLSLLPGVRVDSWFNPGRNRTPIKPFEYQLLISDSRALAILAHIADAANVLLKVVLASEIPGRFDDPNRLRYTLIVPQKRTNGGDASELTFVSSLLVCRLQELAAIPATEADRLLKAWKNALPTTNELVAALNRKRPQHLTQHTVLHGFESLIPGLAAAFPKITHWEGRNSVLFDLIPYARKRPEVVELALAGLQDSACMVRMQACAILAYSLRKDCVPMIEVLLNHKNKKTRDHAAAAIDAIRHQNHNYWFDREHTGSIVWNMNPEDEK
jgi:hypothetical protein